MMFEEELLAQMPEYRGKTLYDILFTNGQVDKFPITDWDDSVLNDESNHFGYYISGLFEEYAEFGRGHAHDLADFDVYHKARGLRWRGR